MLSMEPEGNPDGPRTDPDYSRPEVQAALLIIGDLVLDLRRETGEALREANRKVSLYERSLGLLVIPVLLRRAAIVAVRRIRQGRSHAR